MFEIEDSSLIPLWLNEINNPSEFEKVKNNCSKLGKKALYILLTLDLNQPKISNYATQIVTYLNQMSRYVDTKIVCEGILGDFTYNDPEEV